MMEGNTSSSNGEVVVVAMVEGLPRNEEEGINHRHLNGRAVGRSTCADDVVPGQFNQ